MNLVFDPNTWDLINVLIISTRKKLEVVSPSDDSFMYLAHDISGGGGLEVWTSGDKMVYLQGLVVGSLSHDPLDRVHIALISISQESGS